MAQQILDLLGWILLGTGSLLAVAGGIGLHRFPDLYSRMHAAGVTDTGGAGLVIAGLIVQSFALPVTEADHVLFAVAGLLVTKKALLLAVKLVIILFFLLLTSPTSTHVLARAALTAGIKPLLPPDGAQQQQQEEAPRSPS